MRKRTKPHFLIALLVVCGAIAFGFNAYQGQGNNPADAPQAPAPTDTKPVGESRPAESSSAVAANVKSALNSKSTPAPARPMPRPEGMPGGPGAPSGPLVALPKAPSSAPMKPKPNDSSIAGQWYTPEANHKSGG